MSDILTYTLNLQENISSKLKTVGINNEKQLAAWAKVQIQVNAAGEVMNKMGKSIGSMNERIAALRAQKEWIPAENTVAIRTTNREIKSLEKEIERLNNLNGGKLSKWWSEIKNSMPFQMLANPIVMAGVAIGKLNQYIGESQNAYMQESVEVAKLQKLMQNSMNARQEEIDSVLALISAQQKLGVIGDEIQTSGAQELSTYLTKSESLKKLIPSMNDMLAQQYGLNATQEQAVSIAQMMGKVMDGQVGALSRYGYRFTDAQEKVLKFGTEEQKVATLSNILQQSVGGINEELAKTPEGKLKQYANNAGNLQERIGKLLVKVKAVFVPINEFFLGMFEKVISFFENFGNVVSAHKTAFVIIGTVIGAVTSAIMTYLLWTKLVAVWTQIVTWFKAGEASAWWAATVPMLITVGIIAAIIAAIVAVVATIIYCVKHVSGWGETWDNIMTWMKLGIELFGAKISFIWLNIKDTFLSGFEIIEKGWYKLKSLWDKEGANEGLAKLEQQRNERAKEIAAAKNKVDDISKQMSEMTVWAMKTDGASFGDFIGNAAGKVKNTLGINDKLQNSVKGGGGGSNGGGSASNEAIATGGTRNTTINIQLRNIYENLVMQGGTGENREEIARNMAESFYEILAMADTAA